MVVRTHYWPLPSSPIIQHYQLNYKLKEMKKILQNECGVILKTHEFIEHNTYEKYLTVDFHTHYVCTGCFTLTDTQKNDIVLLLEFMGDTTAWH